VSSLTSFTISPGSALPKVTEIMLASTATEIMPGIEAGLNQLLARIEGELSIKILPIAARAEPDRTQKIYPSTISVLSQAPAISITPPIIQPNFIPNLSRTQLAGKAKIGWKIGKKSTLRVTNTGSYLKLLLTIVLILENV
jgi:hypothetical protein